MVRRVGRVVMLGLVLALCVALMGCQKPGARSGANEYEVLPLDEAPAAVQAYYERMKAIPGLISLTEGGQTYVLLLAGRQQIAGVAVEVVDVYWPPMGTRQPIKIVARVAPTTAVRDTDPHVLLVFPGTANGRFVARLAHLDERVEELRGLPLEDR
jgi:hypothetical protein